MYAAPVLSRPPFLVSLRSVPARVGPPDRHPFTIHALRDLDLEFRSPFTVFVGENGSGKSTLLQAIAELSRLPAAGGGRNQYGRVNSADPPDEVRLADSLRPAFSRRPRSAWYFRADRQETLAERLDSHHALVGDENALYADRALETLSHGEAFLAILNNRAREGLLLLDEPESALSPQRQLALLTLLHGAIEEGNTQVVVATHSPILMTFPGAELLSFDGESIVPVNLADTSHVQITRGILEHPERYWQHLRETS